MMNVNRLGFALFVLMVAYGVLSPAAVAAPSDICQGKRDGKVLDPSATRKYEQGVGFNPAQYLMQSYTSRPIGGDTTKEREKFRIDKLKEFISVRGTAVLDVPTVLELVDRINWTAIQSRKTALGSAVGVSEERGELDCAAGAYIYSVGFFMPKNPLQVLSYPLRTALEAAVDQAVAEAFRGNVSEGFTFRIDEIVERIRKTLAANERVTQGANAPDSALRLLHPRFRQLFPVEIQAKPGIQRGDAFSIGEYRLSPEMAYIIEQLLRRFLRRPELERDAFTLIVRGYADAKPVREIPYSGNCDINNRPNVTIELTAESLGGAAAPSTITSNSQLSIARGCEGARFAKSLIPAARRIRVFYSGVNAVAGAPQDAYRGIELRLERNS